MALKKCTLTILWAFLCILWALLRFLPSLLSVVDVTTMACLYSSRQQARNQTFEADLETYTFQRSVVDLLVASILRGGLINSMYWACCQSPFWFSPQKVFIGTATITGLSTILIVTKLCLFQFSMQADVIETTYARLMFALSLVFAFAECLSISWNLFTISSKIIRNLFTINLIPPSNLLHTHRIVVMSLTVLQWMMIMNRKDGLVDCCM